jgi:hypothetical protein
MQMTKLLKIKFIFKKTGTLFTGAAAKSGQKLSRQARTVVFECTANGGGWPCVGNDIEDPRVAPVPGESKHSLPFISLFYMFPTRRVQLGGCPFMPMHFDSAGSFVLFCGPRLSPIFLYF